MQKYHDEPKQYKGYLKSALASTALAGAAQDHPAVPVTSMTIPSVSVKSRYLLVPPGRP